MCREIKRLALVSDKVNGGKWTAAEVEKVVSQDVYVLSFLDPVYDLAIDLFNSSTSNTDLVEHITEALKGIEEDVLLKKMEERLDEYEDDSVIVMDFQTDEDLKLLTSQGFKVVVMDNDAKFIAEIK